MYFNSAAHVTLSNSRHDALIYNCLNPSASLSSSSDTHSMSSAPQLLEGALRLQREGLLADAEILCRQMLGELGFQAGNYVTVNESPASARLLATYLHLRPGLATITSRQITDRS